MALTELLRLTIDANVGGAVAGITAVGRTAERELGRSEKQLDRWGNRLTTIGSGLIGFGAVAAAGLGVAAQSAGELEQAVGGTEAVFGNASGAIDDFASRSADAIGLSESAFRTATTLIGGQLKRMGLDVDDAAAKSIELTQTAADLAATYGGTTQQAVEALGSAFRGEADPAERFNLDLKIGKVNAEAVALGLASSTGAVNDHARAQAILSLIMKQSADAQGQFNREGDTLLNQQQRMAAAFENLKAQIGEAALPAMGALVDVASDGIGVFKGLNDATDGAVGQFAVIGTVASLGVGGLSLIVGQAIKMRDHIRGAAESVGHLISRIRGMSGAQLAFTGFATAVTAGAVALDQYNRAEQQSNTRRLTDEFLAAGTSAAEMDAVLSSAAKHGVTELVGVFGELASTNRVAAERFIEQAEAAGASDQVISQMREHLETTGAAAAQTAEDTGGLAGAMDDAAGSTEDATSALQSYNDELRAQFDPLFAAVHATRELNDANAEVTAAELTLAAAIRDHGAGSAEAAAAQDALTDAQLRASESALGQESALTTLKDAVDSGAVSVEDAKATLARWVAQGSITQASADATARELDGVTGAANSIPDRVGIDVSANTSGAYTKIVQVRDAVGQLHDKTITIGVTTALGGQAAALISNKLLSGPRAHGGPVGAGRLYEVAEQGRAELLEMAGRTYLIPGADGTVVPAASAMSGGGGGGGGAVVVNNVFHLNGPIGSEAEAVRWMAKAMRAAGESGVPLTVRGRRVA